MTRWNAAWITAALLAALLLLAHLAIRGGTAPDDPVARRRRGLRSLTVGADGRVSTSKVQAVLWTLAVFYALVFMLLVSGTTNCGGALDSGALRASFCNQVNRGLQAEYYVLLGFPLGVALAAKALVSNKVSAGELVKKPMEHEDDNAGPIGDILANDAGEADLVDSQYFAFNLLTLGFFFVQFLSHPANGLPDIPPTLLALSGVAAAVYTTKKALETSDAPAVNDVVVRADSVVIAGTSFGDDAGTVTVGGTDVAVESWSNAVIVAARPPGLAAGDVDVVVKTGDQVLCDVFDAEVPA